MSDPPRGMCGVGPLTVGHSDAGAQDWTDADTVGDRLASEGSDRRMQLA